MAMQKVGLREVQDVGMSIVSVATAQRECGGCVDVDDVPKELQCAEFHSIYAAAMERQGYADPTGDVIKWITHGCLWGR